MGEWYELKDFSRFVVIISFKVQNGFVFESFSFEHQEESNLVLRYFGHEFDGRVKFVCLFNKLIHARIIVVPQSRSVA